MNSNEKVFVYGSVLLLVGSFFGASLHSDTAHAEPPAAVAAAEPPAGLTTAPSAPKAAGDETTPKKAAPAAAAKKAAPKKAAAKKAAAEKAAPEKASEPVAAAAPQDSAPADATDPGCAKAAAAGDKARRGCDKARGGGDKGREDCDMARGGCDMARGGGDKARGGCDMARGGGDMAQGSCKRGGHRWGGDRSGGPRRGGDGAAAGPSVEALAQALTSDPDLSDEQVGRIDAALQSFRGGDSARRAEQKQLAQDLRALWEASPMKPALVKKKAAEFDAAVAVSRAAQVEAMLAMAAVLKPEQYDRVDEFFAHPLKGGGRR